MSSDQIDNAQQVAEVATFSPRGTVAACINRQLADLGDSVRTLPDVGKGLTQIDIGKVQLASFHYFYRIGIADKATGSVVDVRKAPAMSGVLSEERLSEVLTKCAPNR